MNKNNIPAIATTALSVALIVVSTKNLIKTHRHHKALRQQIRTDGDLDVTAVFKARDAVIARIVGGDFRDKSIEDIAQAFEDQIEFEKIAIRFAQM